VSDSYFRVKAYVKYLFSARIGATVHSPFVYSFAKDVLKRKPNKGFYKPINKYRRALYADFSEINKLDLGTGKSKVCSVSSLAKSSSVSKYYGRLLSKISRFQKPKTILELGSCLGVSSLYLTIGIENVSLTSVEGCPETFAKRAKYFTERNLNKPGFNFINENFDVYLTQLGSEQFDLVFIDGNHSYEATKRYFETIWPHIPENGLVIFDDIHWSSGMQKAWNEISNGQYKMISIDLFQFGLCYKRSRQAAESFVLRY